MVILTISDFSPHSFLPFVKLHSRRAAMYVHHSSCSVQLLQQTPVENSRLHSIDPTVPVRKLAILSRINATPKARGEIGSEG